MIKGLIELSPCLDRLRKNNRVPELEYFHGDPGQDAFNGPRIVRDNQIIEPLCSQNYISLES